MALEERAWSTYSGCFTYYMVEGSRRLRSIRTPKRREDRYTQTHGHNESHILFIILCSTSQLVIALFYLYTTKRAQRREREREGKSQDNNIFQWKLFSSQLPGAFKGSVPAQCCIVTYWENVGSLNEYRAQFKPFGHIILIYVFKVTEIQILIAESFEKLR